MGQPDYTSKINIQNHLNITGSTSGTTVDSLTNIQSIDCSSSLYNAIFLKNTGDSNSLDYEIHLLAFPTAAIEHIITSGTLSASDDLYYEIPNDTGAISVYVKSNTSGSPTTFTLEWILKS